jgi:hypothetical protein
VTLYISRVHAPVSVYPFISSQNTRSRSTDDNLMIHLTLAGNISIFSLIPYLKNEIRLIQSPCCLYVCESPPINFWMPEPIFMKPGMYIMAPEPISMAYFINPSHQSLCLYVYPPNVAKQRLGKNVTATKNTYATKTDCWIHRFLYGSCPIEEIKNFLLHGKINGRSLVVDTTIFN